MKARRVALNSRRSEVLELARAELDPSGERIELFPGDVARSETAKGFVAAAARRFGGVDVLVNSTGIFRVKPFTDETEEDFEEAMNSILRPTFYTSQAAVPEMQKRGKGAIVNVGSMWAIDAIASTPTSAYSAAQAGRHALTKNLAIELAPSGIRVNTVALGFVETPAYERFMTPQEAKAVLQSLHSFQPLGRHGYPSDVVEAILFLAGDGAGWITGATLPIDGVCSEDGTRRRPKPRLPLRHNDTMVRRDRGQALAGSRWLTSRVSSEGYYNLDRAANRVLYSRKRTLRIRPRSMTNRTASLEFASLSRSKPLGVMMSASESVDGTDVGRAGLIIEKRQLTEHIARLENGGP